MADDAQAAQAPPPSDEERQLEVYPLRPAAEDPRWALWVVGIWTGFAVASIIFIVVLLILGIWYD
jgi:hypothetical protein